jgi:hypothetical protein
MMENAAKHFAEFLFARSDVAKVVPLGMFPVPSPRPAQRESAFAMESEVGRNKATDFRLANFRKAASGQRQQRVRVKLLG